jgi:hypothetical protein
MRLPGLSRGGRASFDPIRPPLLPFLSQFTWEMALRESHSALRAAGQSMSDRRDAMVEQWADWLGERLTSSNTIARSSVERELGLILDTLIEMVGPYRREVKPVWFEVCEHYGRMAAARGLSAGEVVEEMQYLRELLTLTLSPVLAAMRARAGLAIMLRLNRVLDKGIAVAVVGYTDALVATLFSQNGVPATGAEFELGDVERRLDSIEDALVSVTRPAEA